MSGGSDTKESPHDKQCPHCHKWYMDRGVAFETHKVHCDAKSNGDGEPDGELTEGPNGSATPSESDDDPDMTDTTKPDSPPGERSSPAPDDPGPCPECGGELMDFRNQETYSEGGRAVDTPDDYYCSQCGAGWVWE